MTRIAVAALSALALPACVTATDESFTVTDPLVGVSVALSSGSVTVTEGAPGEAHVAISYGGAGLEPAQTNVVDGVLFVDLDCAGVCGGDVTLEVPPGAWVALDVQRGEVTVSGIEGNLDVDVATGSIVADGLRSAEVTLRTAAGDIFADVVGRPLWVEAAAAAGAVDLVVPRGAWALTVDVDVGDAAVEGVEDDGAADRVLLARAGAGSISIRGE